MTGYAFTLFVTGATTRAQRAVDGFRAVCERTLGGDYELTVVDVLVDTQLAEDHNVVATPTVVRTRPGPVRRAVGEVRDPARLIATLGLDEGDANHRNRTDARDRAGRQDRIDTELDGQA